MQVAEHEAWQRLLLVAVLLVLAYAFLWPATTGDMRNFLIPWLDVILQHGRVGAFAQPFANYTPPYLYLLSAVSPLASILPKSSVIKLLSVFGTAALGLAAHRLLRSIGSSKPTEGALWLLLMPTIVANAAGMGQADGFWTAACVMAVTCAIERRSLAMLMWFGIAVAFKAQAIFLAPFIAQRLVQRKVPLLLWPVPLLVYALAMAPAALAGWPVWNLLTVYVRQADWNPAFIGNATNPWSLVQYIARSGGRAWLWTGEAAALVAAIALTGVRERREAQRQSLMNLALLAALVIPFLLPKMHERFFFLADVLAFVLAWSSRDFPALLILALVEGGSIAALAGLLLRQPLFPIAGAAMVTFAIFLVLGRVLRGQPAPAANMEDERSAYGVLSAG